MSDLAHLYLEAPGEPIIDWVIDHSYGGRVRKLDRQRQKARMTAREMYRDKRAKYA